MPHEVLVPDKSHPIAIEQAGQHVRVTAGGQVIADTDRALVLREANYPPVYYLPRADVDPTVLRESATSTHCPYKGDAVYFDVVTDDGRIADAAWSYPEAHPAVREIADHLAWYPNRVVVTAE